MWRSAPRPRGPARGTRWNDGSTWLHVRRINTSPRTAGQPGGGDLGQPGAAADRDHAARTGRAHAGGVGADQRSDRARLFISVRTAGHHLESASAKLGPGDRASCASIAVASGLLSARLFADSAPPEHIEGPGVRRGQQRYHRLRSTVSLKRRMRLPGLTSSTPSSADRLCRRRAQSRRRMESCPRDMWPGWSVPPPDAGRGHPLPRHPVVPWPATGAFKVRNDERHGAFGRAPALAVASHRLPAKRMASDGVPNRFQVADLAGGHQWPRRRCTTRWPQPPELCPRSDERPASGPTPIDRLPAAASAAAFILMNHTLWIVG